MSRKAFNAEGAVAVGPYSHAVASGELVFLSGQTPIDSSTGKLVQGDIAAQTEQCFQNLFQVLNSAGLGPDDVVKVNVFLTDMANFEAMNKVYAGKFARPYPARTTIGVASLPLGAQVEIEMIAKRK
ncbi:RidA family protein [Pontibacter virosus]|uniref:2-iminobutanoate/2-iminopropanoate deaminase n=1 Tax=Pontibacter virosus TaxID=1765052 RepID=A0A2U1AZM1_9BACT|nr:Rid family detoxifying hydrolase [Pontibacter virosus]PVY41875.1 2-iminobutanoate/2-iminopropanoate deaminase [Pontibacter virosus]